MLVLLALLLLVAWLEFKKHTFDMHEICSFALVQGSVDSACSQEFGCKGGAMCMLLCLLP